VRVDSKWRIVIPRRFRGDKGRDVLIVEADGDAMVLRKEKSEDLVEKFQATKLTTSEDMRKGNAELAKAQVRRRKGMRIIDADILSYALLENHIATPFAKPIVLRALKGELEVSVTATTILET